MDILMNLKGFCVKDTPECCCVTCTVAPQFLLTSGCVLFTSITVAEVPLLFHFSDTNSTNCTILTGYLVIDFLLVCHYCPKLSLHRSRDAQSWEVPALGQ